MPDPDMSLLRLLGARAKGAGGGGGPYDGGMLEDRVAALETDMREVKGSLGRIEAMLTKMDERLRKVELDLAEVKGRVINSPTTFAMITTGFGMVLTTAGLILAIVRFGIPR